MSLSSWSNWLSSFVTFRPRLRYNHSLYGFARAVDMGVWKFLSTKAGRGIPARRHSYACPSRAVGTYHKVSRKYLALHVAEFQFCYNSRLNADFFEEAIRGC
jgi:hypothetical protein